MEELKEFVSFIKEKDKRKDYTVDNFYVPVMNGFMRNNELNHYEKLIYIYLQGYGQNCFVAHSTISKDLGISRSTVIRTLKSLEEKDWLCVIQRYNEKERLTNVYIIAPLCDKTCEPNKAFVKLQRKLHT